MTKDEAVSAVLEFAKALKGVPESMFNGAYLISPPESGEKVDGVIVSSNPDQGTFWPYCAGIVQVELQKVQAADREGGQGYRGRLR